MQHLLEILIGDFFCLKPNSWNESQEIFDRYKLLTTSNSTLLVETDLLEYSKLFCQTIHLQARRYIVSVSERRIEFSR